MYELKMEEEQEDARKTRGEAPIWQIENQMGEVGTFVFYESETWSLNLKKRTKCEQAYFRTKYVGKYQAQKETNGQVN